jgi:hypothetical protein
MLVGRPLQLGVHHRVVGIVVQLSDQLVSGQNALDVDHGILVAAHQIRFQPVLVDMLPSARQEMSLDPPFNRST